MDWQHKQLENGKSVFTYAVPDKGVYSIRPDGWIGWNLYGLDGDLIRNYDSLASAKAAAMKRLADK